MTIALEHDTTAPRAVALPASTTSLLGVAGLTSLGAGAIHAAAIGVHSEHRSAVLAFTAVAALQLAWGVLALIRGNRLVAIAGALIGVGAVAGWATAKISGIGPIAGLDEAEPIQTADALAAGLAVASVVLIAGALWSGRGNRGGVRAPVPFLAVGVTALTVFGMVTAGSHAGVDHGGASVATDHGGVVAADAAKAVGAPAHDDSATGDEGGVAVGDSGGGEHEAAVAVPYDPTKPIDLGGTEGVTPEQQAAAENLIAVTLHGLRQWEDPAVAEAAGFRSIGDGFTGTEHLINQANMDDDTTLDPDVPESLVYDTTNGGRRLMAAMYMTEVGLPLENVPDIGGALMQWHTHENLCFTAEGLVRGITDAAGNCANGLTRPVPTPMIHVWTQPHPCGPFAALEGIGGGRILDGETKLCDTAHGA